MRNSHYAVITAAPSRLSTGDFFFSFSIAQIFLFCFLQQRAFLYLLWLDRLLFSNESLQPLLLCVCVHCPKLASVLWGRIMQLFTGSKLKMGSGFLLFLLRATKEEKPIERWDLKCAALSFGSVRPYGFHYRPSEIVPLATTDLLMPFSSTAGVKCAWHLKGVSDWKQICEDIFGEREDTARQHTSNHWFIKCSWKRFALLQKLRLV